MLCCLLAFAVLAPFGIGAVQAPGNAEDCCAVGRRGLKITALVLSIAALGSGVSLMLQPAPFQHICRFIVSRS